MSANDATPPKDELLKEIWQICTTLTPEALDGALKKSNELGFDPNRGIVPLQESLINLSSARVVLEDAIEKEKLIQLPITVQRELLTDLQAISKSLQGLQAGTDEVVNISDAVEALNTAIWKYGFYNLSDQVLGYQRKLNQLKNQEVQLTTAITKLESAQDAAQKANSAATEIEQRRTEMAAALQQLKQDSAASTSLLAQMKDAGDKASAIYSTIQQQEKQSGEFVSGIKTANNELLALDTSIRKFYGEVEEYRKKINQTSEAAASLLRESDAAIKKTVQDGVVQANAVIGNLQKNAESLKQELTSKISAEASAAHAEVSKTNSDSQTAISSFRTEVETTLKNAVDQANETCSKLLTDTQTRVDTLQAQLNQRSSETIEANQQETERLIEELAKLKGQIKEQIQQATGFSLFGAFQSRQNEIANAKNRWAYAIAGLVVISAGVTAWIAHEAQFYSANSFAFWVKLSLTIPLAFAIAFCTVQYNRERRLEEEYAFKSSISVSLNPYRDLIQSILKDAPEDKSRYADFVIDSVRNVFTPPTDKVFETEQKRGFTAKVFKQTAEIIGTAVKAAK